MGVTVLKAGIGVKLKHSKPNVQLSVIDELLFHKYQKEIDESKYLKNLGRTVSFFHLF